jgi:hypothetical protein
VDVGQCNATAGWTLSDAGSGSVGVRLRLVSGSVCRAGLERARSAEVSGRATRLSDATHESPGDRGRDLLAATSGRAPDPGRVCRTSIRTAPHFAQDRFTLGSIVENTHRNTADPESRYARWWGREAGYDTDPGSRYARGWEYEAGYEIDPESPYARWWGYEAGYDTDPESPYARWWGHEAGYDTGPESRYARWRGYEAGYHSQACRCGESDLSGCLGRMRRPYPVQVVSVAQEA